MRRTTARLAPVLIVIGGLLAIWGFGAPWATCPHDPCDAYGGLMRLVTRYGFEYGTGVATAAVGMALVVVGVVAAGLGGTALVRRIAIGLATGQFVLIGIHLGAVHLFPKYFVYGPGIGVIAVILGAAVSMAGSALLRPRRTKVFRRGGTAS